MSSPTPTKKERREAARQARMEREAAEAAAARRRRRLYQLLAAVGAAVVLVVVAILVSGSGGGDKTASDGGSGLAGRQETVDMLAGVPQKDNVLGNENAPVTLYEFADLQCPFCGEFAKNNLPLLVRDYVRPGKVKVVYQDMAFIGNDSETAAAAAAAAGEQGKLWHFTNLFYWNQGQENTGYVTDQFLTNIYKGIPGLDVAEANAARTKAPATNAVAEPRRLADQFGISSTPSFVAGPSGGRMQTLDTKTLQYDELKKQLDPIVQKASQGT
ncbi:MAG TPA: thioredoxin domain-containing protein [Solirubrobacteraceae bacterium]|nr:thioredoxin domain-containing protein [Solirubrobacteraceae bacterium]